MPISTPRGLKIRLQPEYAFSLLARLDPQVHPFRVLKTVEGIAEIPSATALIAGLLCFIARLEPTAVLMYVLIATLIARLLTLYGWFVIPGMVAIGTAYSYLAGFGILILIVGAVGMTTVGWRGVAAFFVAKVFAGAVGYILELWEVKRVFRHTGVSLTGSERSFLNAYRLHASHVG